MQRPQADERNEMGLIRGKSALHQVLEAVVKIEKGKVITGPADSVGLILYNVDVSLCDWTVSFMSVVIDIEIARESWIIVIGELQTRDLCLPESTNHQCRGNQKGHQIDGGRQRAVPRAHVGR